MSHILTLVAAHPQKPLTLEHVRSVSDSEYMWLSKDKAVDLICTEKPSFTEIQNWRERFMEEEIDVFCTPTENRRKKLLLADMDSTIVTGETLDDLAAFAGLKEKIAAITTEAMNGQLDFHEALEKRVQLLKDLPTSALKQALAETQISPGAETLIKTMRTHGATCILISGGFTFFTAAIAAQLGFDAHHGNQLEIKEDKLTGRVILPIEDKDSKLNYLNHYAAKKDVQSLQALAIGDGANDLPMLSAAGLGIGYRPKPIVKTSIENIILHGDLSTALYVQGYQEEEIV